MIKGGIAMIRTVENTNVVFGKDGKPVSFDGDIACIDAYNSRSNNPGVAFNFKTDNAIVNIAAAEKFAFEILALVNTCRERQESRTIFEIISS